MHREPSWLAWLNSVALLLVAIACKTGAL